jgi:tetratricopeptide (TPR) repeat protein
MSSEGYQRYFDQQKTSQFLLKVEGKNASRGGDEFRSIWQALDEESSSFWFSYHDLTADALLATDEDAARRGFIRKWLNCHKNTQGEWKFRGIWYDREPHPKTQPTIALSAHSIRTHGQQLLYDSQYNTAIEEFKKVLALQPNDAESYSGIAECFYYLDDTSSALQAIDAALSINSKASKFWEIKGNILNDKGDEDSARDHWRHAVDLDPKNASAWTSLGDSWLGMGQIDPATGAFQRAIDADSDDVQRHTKLVLCFLLSENIASAKQALSMAFKVFPNDPQLKAIDTMMTAIENGADASNPEQLKQVLETLKVTLLQKER